MVPWHVIFYSFPFVLGFVVPVIAGFVWWKIQKHQMNYKQWPVVFAVTFLFFLSMILTSFSGKFEKSRAREQVQSSAQGLEILDRHDNISDTSVWISAGLCFFSLLGCRESASRSRQALMYLALFNLIPLIMAVHSGWQLVHEAGVSSGARAILLKNK